MNFALFEPQQKALVTMHAQLMSGGITMLKAGQRGGKTVILTSLVERVLDNYDLVVVCSVPQLYDANEISNMKSMSEELNNSSKLITEAEYLSIPEDKKPSDIRTLFCLVELFWMPNPWELVTSLCELGDVVITTSCGPHYDKEQWKYIPSQSFSTWELNPRVTRKDLGAEYRVDPIKAKRDFEGF